MPMAPRPTASFVALTALGALLAAAPVAHAEAAGAAGTGWVPAPSPSWSFPAGTRCDFPVSTAPVLDEVVRRTLETHPDGSPKLVEYKGDLVVRVTNGDTGATWDADASARAVVEIREDRSQLWTVQGPILAGFAANGGTLARGLYTVEGAYTLEVSATGYKTLTMLHGTTDALCDRVG